MDRVVLFPASQRSDLFSETAARKGTTPAVVEKDFWVTWVLCRLFRQTDLARLLIFKGGTSLSKVYHLIERFSEDIDLILDWRVLTGADPLAERSRNKQSQLNKAIDEQAQVFIGGELLRRVSELLGGVCECATEEHDLHVINIRYPAAYSDAYLRPEVRLEIGPLASWLPHQKRTISCYAAEEFPDVFERKECPVRVIKAERTFWEKATILHHEAHRPEGNPQTLRYSRHYYDLAKMAESSVKQASLADTALLESVVDFKQRFYPRGWARYDLAKPGTMRLIPEAAVRDSLAADYRAMVNMIFGEIPSFHELMSGLQKLQDEINGSGK